MSKLPPLQYGKKNPLHVEDITKERSMVIIKPDGVVRQIAGDIISRFERKGLKIIAMKMVHPTKSQVDQHYEVTEEWISSNGQRTYDSYVAKGLTPPAQPRELAIETRRKLMNYMGAGPVIAMVLEGAHVIEIVRKIRGATSPLNAEAGSVGFDFSLESYELADAGNWAVRNTLHGSDSREAAEREIPLWFKEDELIEYETAIERYIYDDAWHMPAKEDKK
jgi:nucleoside-diphosphate kinase